MKRDKRTREEKLRVIVKAVADAGEDGVKAEGKESAQRVLARMTQIPQHELTELMPDAVAESAHMYPGKRLLIPKAYKPDYTVQNFSKRGHVKMVAIRTAAATTKMVRAANELDVALAGSEQIALQSDLQALNVLAAGLAVRIREFADRMPPD